MEFVVRLSCVICEFRPLYDTHDTPVVWAMGLPVYPLDGGGYAPGHRELRIVSRRSLSKQAILALTNTAL